MGGTYLVRTQERWTPSILCRLSKTKQDDRQGFASTTTNKRVHRLAR